MRKFTIYNLQFTIFLVFSFFILHSTFYIPTAVAVESSPSADIKAKLDELKKEIASKAAKLKQAVNRKLKDKAYVGKVKTKSATSLTLATSSGLKIVSLNQDTVFENNVKSKQKFSQKTIVEENYLVALGDVDETAVLTAKKVILLPEKEEMNKTPLWGQVIAISDKLLTVKNKDGKNIAVSLPSGSTVKLNEFLILTGKHNKNEIFTAEFVYIIPQGGIIKPKGKIATPSAQTATPSAKPKSIFR